MPQKKNEDLLAPCDSFMGEVTMRAMALCEAGVRGKWQ